MEDKYSGMTAIANMLKDIPIPPMKRMRQSFDNERLLDIEGELRKNIAQSNGYKSIKKGMKIAITAGSRGVANMPLCIKTIVDMLKEAGAEPFVFPAMGSHGGATAEGQRDMLDALGINEETVGAPIVSSMDTRLLCHTDSGIPVYMDKNAFEADGIVVINKVKPHVSFRGDVESGVTKMIAIGMGKQKGAETCHNIGVHKLSGTISQVAGKVIERKNIVFAVGLVENAFHELYSATVMEKNEIPTKEPELLKLAWQKYGSLLFDSCDVLIMDEIGKNISGTGFDTNVVGRYYSPIMTGGPNITRVAILDLTDVSHGNANGMGLADMVCKRLYDKFIPEQVYANALTSTVTSSNKLPMVLESDRQTIQAAIKTASLPDMTKARVVRIKNTNEVDVIAVSPAMEEYLAGNPRITAIDDDFSPLSFDENGNLF